MRAKKEREGGQEGLKSGVKTGASDCSKKKKRKN